MGADKPEKVKVARATTRAGLAFQIGPVKKVIKEVCGKKKTGKTVAAQVAALAELCGTSLLVLADNQAKNTEKKIEPHHIHEALSFDASPLKGVFPVIIGGLH